MWVMSALNAGTDGVGTIVFLHGNSIDLSSRAQSRPMAFDLSTDLVGKFLRRWWVSEFSDELLELWFGVKTLQIVIGQQAIGVFVPAIDRLL